MKIFLTYASEDKATAEPIAFSLRDRGHIVFLDRDDLPPGKSFDQRIERAIKDSDILVFLISPDSVEDGRFTLTELSFARHKWRSPNNRVLPVMVRKTPLEQVPTYLKAVTILEPAGNVAAETSAAVEKMRFAGQNFKVLALCALGGAVAAVALLAFLFFFGAQSKDLSGPWICYDECQKPGGEATVAQDGKNLVFINEVGQVSQGRWVNSRQVIATNWGGLLGDLSFGGRVIQWHNPTRWIRPARCFFTNACTGGP